MRYAIVDKAELWNKLIEGRAIYLVNFETFKISNAANTSVKALKVALENNHIIFIEDIAPDYDNQGNDGTGDP